MSAKRSKELLLKYMNEDCTPEEKAIVESWYNEISAKQKHDLSEPDYMTMKQEIFNAIHIEERKHTLNVQKLWPRIAVAASIVVCIGIGFYFYQKNQTIPTEITAKNDIAPGGNKAFLTLADGKRITLTNAKTGELAEQSGVKITKAADGQLIYTVSSVSNKKNKINAYNTIETPRGGNYQVRLPDGTKVWLNAASTIKYPVSFASLKERRVTLLSGEAYFEVAKDKKHPFIVKSPRQEIEVLGTHFNINAYTDEGKTTTSLIEGSVKIIYAGNSQMLQPGEQAISSDNSTVKMENGAEDAIAWKQGIFHFEDADVKAVFRQLSRWYDMDIVYENDVKSYRFTGEISKSLNLSEALSGLQFIGLKFKVEGKRIVVANK